MSTKISWTTETWNPVTGCTKVSPGCKNCYAERMAERLQAMGNKHYANGFALTLQPDMLERPLHWRKPKLIFVNSMSDLFHKDVQFEYIDRVFAVMALARQHTFQILTKRPERMAQYIHDRSSAGGNWFIETHYVDLTARKTPGRLPPDYKAMQWPLPNVWLGTSVENQATADERIPHLMQCMAAVRFLSCEPLLGPIRLAAIDEINWVIVGGESGPGFRPCKLEWIESIVSQCRAAGVPVFVKQFSGPRSEMRGPIPDDLWIQEWPNANLA